MAEWSAAAARSLERAGFTAADARRDAAVIARSVLGWDAATWLLRQTDEAPPRLASEADPLIARRTRHEPVAYLTGQREFYGRNFLVSPAVLIPRPETELVVSEALGVGAGSEQGRRRVGAGSEQGQTRVGGGSDPEPLRIADIGTGSGCLAVTLAAELANATVLATDTSESALDVARRNAGALGVSARVRFVRGSLLDGAPPQFDLIVSNPPYVRDDERATLAPDVIDYEPHAALFAGADGLDVIRALVPAAAARLTRGGHLVMEIGAGQDRDVAHIVAATGRLSIVRIAPDLQGIPRVVVARAL
ncbi:MAG TPA: peptide chain release factor N(5)-glutamine methyltransferase [Vicinamibacterales bacterium]|nr:peptide chain release factor N(5)-glutamine methyltransferase [Vicinamibacterales bacterium]